MNKKPISGYFPRSNLLLISELEKLLDEASGQTITPERAAIYVKCVELRALLKTKPYKRRRSTGGY